MQVITDYDVIIVGGGPGGAAAAIAAGRAGAKTLLLEREGCLGGGMTTMLVHPFMPHRTWGSEGQPHMLVSAGLFAEMVQRLATRGAAKEGHWIEFDDEYLKIVLDEMASEARVTVLFHTALYDVERDGDAVSAALFAHNGGPLRVTGRIFVDGTGDALLAACAGCAFQCGDDHGHTMPMTQSFLVGGVDRAQVPDYPEFIERTKRGAEDTPALLNTNFSCYSFTPSGFFHMNAVRVPGHTLNPLDVSHAEAEGRRRVENYIIWLRAHMPGFANCYLIKTGAHVGVRENRRIIGDYLLSLEDWQRRATFDDAIACCAYSLDIHSSVPNEYRLEHYGPGEYYQIPYRSLTPRGLRNLVIAGRSISADRPAHSSLRVMATVMNIGEAAGLAAAHALPAGDVRAIDISQLRQALRDAGAVLEPSPDRQDICTKTGL